MDKVDVRFPQPAKSAPAPNLPKNAEERATALVDLMGRLAAHLRRETAAVRNRRFGAELTEIAREKQPMALVFEEISRLLRIDREGMAKLPPELKGKLKDATRALYEASAENAELLRRNGEAQQVLVDTVVGAVNRARQVTTVAYNPASTGASRGGTASGRPYGGPTHGPATAATLNTRL